MGIGDSINGQKYVDTVGKGTALNDNILNKCISEEMNSVCRNDSFSLELDYLGGFESEHHKRKDKASAVHV